MPEKEKEEVKYLDEAQIKAIVSSVAPQGLQEKIKAMQDKHQSNYRDHDDVVAVLDVSSATLSEIDGIPGTLDVVTGNVFPNEPEPRYPAQFTEQGLRVVDRYKVVINFLPTTERKYEFTLVPVKEWAEHAATKRTSFGLNNEQMIASYMLRAGASEAQ